MHSIATYTPLESLLFFQSVARHGADADSLTEISESLISNKFIREDGNYSPGRLQPEALKGLYTTLVDAERGERTDKDASLNAHPTANGSNPRKRKLSPASTPSSHNPPKDDERLVTELVDRLYAQYKEQIVKEICQDEEEYEKLQREVTELENERPGENAAEVDRTAQEGQGSGQKQQIVTDTSAAVTNGDPSALDTKSESMQAQSRMREEFQGVDSRAEGVVGNTSRPAPDPPRMGAEDISLASLPPVQRQSVPPAQGQTDLNPRQIPSPSSMSAQRAPQLSHAQPSQSPLNRTLPPPYLQHTGYGPVPAQHNFPGPASPRSPVILPPPPGMTHMAHQRTPSDGGPPRGPPVSLPHPQPYQPYPPYNFPQAPWPQQPHPHQQYPQHPPPYASQHFYPQPVASRHPYPYYLQSVPTNQPMPASMAQPGIPATGYPRQLQSASATSTPVNDRVGRRGQPRMSGSHTPWTPKAGTAGGLRPASPVRPERDVSPLSDPDSPLLVAMDEHADSASSNRKPGKQGRRGPKPTTSVTSRLGRRKRADSNASSIMGSKSRSQSLASFASESRAERASTARKVKHEPPSTPVPLPSDNDQQRSSDLRRGRGNTLASQLDIARSTTKRKRDSTHEISPSPSLPTPRGPSSRLRPRPEATDPNMVSVTKNFARLTGTVMNDVTSHKYAGIFAKPLSEREAPGYKDLIYRPQDLKSIKTAIGRGSRTANAAIDELAGGDDGVGAETPSKGTGIAGTAAGGTTLLKKTDELAPPKGIVNSSQLEMELMRLFANAAMFNPLPANERGLGPQFKMQRVDGKGATDPNSTQEGDEEGSKGYSYVQVEEGGIIADTREMCEYVEKAVGDWRSAELGLGETTLPRSSAGLGVRGASISSALGDENGGVSDTEGTKTEGGTARKRRRVEA
jgi:hypothetical protein